MDKPKQEVADIKAEAYNHPTVDSPMRPEIGTQAQFKQRKQPETYRYDSSLSPQLEWDTNSCRELGHNLIKQILTAQSLEDAKVAADKLDAMSSPFLNWAGKAERSSFEVPTLPLFIHERFSTKAIIETIKDRKRQSDLFDIFHQEKRRPATEQIIKAYEHRDKWVNRMILGDSLAAMNSLLHYEHLAGKVQMIYMDPPYGIRFASNFQPFLRSRDVSHNDDSDMTREPEMIQAYRDTWELGIHSYLSYLRDRVLLMRSLLAESGSIFVQISDENLHYVRHILDEVFGPENFMNLITFRVKSPLGVKHLGRSTDFIIWYAKDKNRVRYRQIYTEKKLEDQPEFNMVELQDGTRMTTNECVKKHGKVPEGSRYFTAQNLGSSGYTESCMYNFTVNKKVFSPPRGKSWKTNLTGMENLLRKNRLLALPNSLRFVYYFDDFPVQELSNFWDDTFAESDKLYVVQTTELAIKRCMLMTTDPGDLVFDPTCGSGTTAVVAEEWGRRWITTDVSRVPLALARQRLLTRTYDYFQLNNSSQGPSGGFTFTRKQNKRGQEIGGIVPHITLKSVAQNEPPKEEVLVDRPDIASGVVRVTGPFVFEATIPTPVNYDQINDQDINLAGTEEYESFSARMLEVLKRSPILKLDKKKEIKLKDIRRPTKTLALSAEATSINGKNRQVALLFGPENGAVSDKAIYAAVQEAHLKGYEQLIIIGFAIEPTARMSIQQCEEAVGIPAIYVQATPDLMMGGLLKTMRSSQIFSVCGMPEFRIKKVKPKVKSDPPLYQIELMGLDILDPATMETTHRDGNDVPAWFLDTDYNGLVFHVDQAFFPKTGAWDNLKRALKGVYDDSTWEHLAGTTSAPFEAGGQNQIAIKVIDERGNELITVKSLKDEG